jgi:hypothetical protein
MTYAHGHRRIHRDLKPENVLIVDGVPMIGDFGLGKRLDQNTAGLTQTNMSMGTYPYMAPECFTNAAHVGEPADVYALGKMFVEMLTGTTPAVGKPRTDNLPEKFRSFVEKCTEEDPTDRYANAADALVAFRLLISQSTDDTSEATVESLLKSWETTPLGEDADVVREIAMALVVNKDNEELLWEVFPRLPDTLIEQLMADHALEFDVILRAYNGHIQGGLPFSYCDVAANFYRRVYGKSSDMNQKRLLLERLIQLGPSHNRWHVGDVVAVMLQGITETPEAEMAAELIRADPVSARWYEEYVRNRSLLAPISKAFDSLRPQVDDDLPF